MKLAQLETFIAVAEELHFRRAAQRLHTQASTVSMQISRLEAEYGVELFARNSRNVELTSDGHTLLHKARTILADVYDLESTARRLAQPHRVSLKIGVFDEGLAELEEIVRSNFAALYPSASVELNPLEYEDVTGALAARRVDLVLAPIPAAWFEGSGTAHVPLFAEYRCAVLPRNHSLAALPEITSDHLLDQPFLRVDAPAPMHDFFTLGDRRDRSISPDIDVVATHMHDLLSHVAANVGIFTTTAATQRFYPRPDVSYVPVGDLEPGTLHVVSSDDEQRPHVVAYIDECINAVNTSLDLIPTATNATPQDMR